MKRYETPQVLEVSQLIKGLLLKKTDYLEPLGQRLEQYRPVVDLLKGYKIVNLEDPPKKKKKIVKKSKMKPKLDGKTANRKKRR